ncbi:MAG TPA: aspartate kinase [Candidatus Baltobacteraceae bacterium]|jgi:aspartate kinase|nr:aspartate kinase [Candidatus Baltobacteraceae bacterium]
MTTLKPVVLKFGGTSVATPELRRIAIDRLMDERAAGYDPVAVVSAMGRAPEPYATDTLLGLGQGKPGTHNSDLLASCGEVISAAVFAQTLECEGIAAVALTGAQAGIITNARCGDAKILRVDPWRVRELLEEGVLPVVAGFQGVTEDGEITTLGRGGTDLTAIALGHALDAERVDIYTDVSGAMTGDPRRIEGAHTIARASLEEMTELAEHGAKVMHHKAADLAHRTGTPYAIKGLRTGTGTLVDDGVEHEKPVTGVTASGRVTWIRVIRGDIEDQERRMQVELQMFSRIAEAGLSIDQVTINQAGVMFVVEGDRGSEIRRLLGDLNLAVRVREGCSKLSVVGAAMRYTPGVVHRIVSALSKENVEIIHATDSNITVSVLVPSADAQRAEQAVHDEFHLEQKSDVREPA